jgi:hypothetical protein
LTAVAAVLIIGPPSAFAGQAPPPNTLMLTKTGPNFVNQGDNATYTFQLTNSSTTQDISNISISDDKCSPLSGPTGDDGNDGILSADSGETWTYTCTYAPQDAPGTTVTDTANATGDPNQSAQATHQTTITALHITKTVDKPTADPFDDLNYTITVTNDGPDFFEYEGVVTDQNCQPVVPTDPQVKGPFFDLTFGQSATFTCTHNYNPSNDGNPFVNTACANADVFNNNLQSVTPEGVPSDLVVCASASTSLAQHFVTGQVFEDLNADGVKQGNEPAFPGIVIYADLNNNGVRDEGEPSSTSDGQGNYSVPVNLGTTTIREDVPSGVTCSFPTGCAYTVTLPQNSPPPPPPDFAARAYSALAANPTGKDFGDWRPASVSGTVVGDTNSNGVRDAGESGLGGVTVYADLNNNGAPDSGEPSTTSAADGSYTIAGLKPGGYVIRQVVPQLRTCTAPTPNCNYDLTLISNQAETNKDFLDSAPAQLVAPAKVDSGRATLRGRTGCINGSGFPATVRGVSIQRAVFSLDGKVVKTVTRPKNNSTVTYRVNVTKLSIGRHRITVKVTFLAGSGTKSKTLRLSFQRCAKRLVAPQFTG